jgi:hypothetical protein
MLDPHRRRRCSVGRAQNAFAPGWAAVNNGRVTDQPAPSSPAPAPAPTPSRSALDPAVAALLKRDDAGLVAAVVQDEASRDVLMVGWMDDEALHRTLTSDRTCFNARVLPAVVGAPPGTAGGAAPRLAVGA